MGELTLEKLLEKILNLEKISQQKEVIQVESRAARDLDYVRQNILSDIK